MKRKYYLLLLLMSLFFIGTMQAANSPKRFVRFTQADWNALKTGDEIQMVLVFTENSNNYTFYDMQDRNAAPTVKNTLHFVKEKDGALVNYNNSSYDTGLDESNILPTWKVKNRVVNEGDSTMLELEYFIMPKNGVNKYYASSHQDLAIYEYNSKNDVPSNRMALMKWYPATQSISIMLNGGVWGWMVLGTYPTNGQYVISRSQSTQTYFTPYVGISPEITVTLDANSDVAKFDNGQSTKEFKGNPPVAITLPLSLTDQPYNLLGFDSNAQVEEPTYTAGSAIQVMTEQTLYAIYDVPKATTTFVSKHGTPSFSSKQANKSFALPTMLNVHVSYTFLGWNTDEQGTGTMYNAGDNYTPTGNATLYAIFSQSDPGEVWLRMTQAADFSFSWSQILITEGENSVYSVNGSSLGTTEVIGAAITDTVLNPASNTQWSVRIYDNSDNPIFDESLLPNNPLQKVKIWYSDYKLQINYGGYSGVNEVIVNIDWAYPESYFSYGGSQKFAIYQQWYWGDAFKSYEPEKYSPSYDKILYMKANKLILHAGDKGSFGGENTLWDWTIRPVVPKQPTLSSAAYELVGWAKKEGATEPDYAADEEITISEDGMNLYAVYALLGVAVKDDVAYSTIQAAIDAVGEGTVTIVQNTTEDLTINKAVVLACDGNISINGKITITTEGKLTLSDNLTIANLFLNTTTGASAQLVNSSKLTVSGDTYLDVELEPNAVKASDSKWYSVSTPFAVDITTGIAPADGSEAKGFSVYAYDGALRNSSQSSGWVKMEKSNITMQPGAFHMLTINGTCNVWRFKKSEGAIEKTTVTPIYQYGFNESTNKIHGGWNGVGNTLVQYAKASVANDILFGQVYDNATGTYEVKTFTGDAATSFVIGRPFFIQSGSTSTLTFTPDATGTAYVPNRQKASSIEIYHVALSDGQRTDMLYLVSNEDATDDYQVGQDVLKMMGGQQYLYIWANAYSQMLCAQSAHPAMDGTTDYTVTLYAPKAGTYQLTASEKDAPIYLVDGTKLQLLGADAFDLNLSQGMNKYTIRLGQRKISTNLTSSPFGDGWREASKVIMDGMLYIIRNGEYYNAQGQLIK